MSRETFKGPFRLDATCMTQWIVACCKKIENFLSVHWRSTLRLTNQQLCVSSQNEPNHSFNSDKNGFWRQSAHALLRPRSLFLISLFRLFQSYRPLLEFCRSRRIPVTGSNCPRRYSRLVAKNGREILTTLPEGSRKLIAPVTYRDASDDYRRNFLNAMNVVYRDEVALDDRMVKMLDSQTLWDSTMAFSIFESLKTCEIIFHLSGYFHVQNDLGIVEHLRRLDEDVECRSVVILPDENPHLDETNRNLADWIVVTDINRE